MIYTSSYKTFNNKLCKSYSISGDYGKNALYNGDCFSLLIPKISFWKKWNDSKGIILEEANNRLYVLEYYRQVLMKLDPEEVYKMLNESVLLCYEDGTEFCHRHIVAEWLQLLLDVKVPEIKINNNIISIIERPTYIREYLEDAMRKSIDTMGFKSLRALYLFYKSEELEQMAMDVIDIDLSKCKEYREKAKILRDGANNLESKHIRRLKYVCKY